MKNCNELRAIALAQVGNGGKTYRKYAGLGSGQPWCNAFVYWLYDAHGCGSVLPFKGTQKTYAPASYAWAKKHLAQIPPYLTMPCDLVYFDWDKNGVPNHIGISNKRRTATSIYTIEGNTSGGKVDTKTRTGYILAVFRPHLKPNIELKKAKLDCKGLFGYLSTYNLQLALGMKPTGILTKETVKYLQKAFGATQDGSWQKGTSTAIQKKLKTLGYYKGELAGEFGAGSASALQKWINAKNYPAKKPAPKKTTKPTPKATKPAPKTAPKTTPTAKKPATPTKTSTTAKKPVTTAKKPVKAPVKKTNQQKLIDKMKELAWAYGTAKRKYDYETGAPKKVCKEAMKKYGWADSRAEMSDCGNFVSTVVREAGIDKKFKALHGIKTPFPKTEKAFNIVLKGKKIPSGFLKAGDVIRYKKTNGKQHAMFYFGDGKVCEASHHNLFGVIRKDTKRYNTQSKVKTIQVLRVKP